MCVVATTGSVEEGIWHRRKAPKKWDHQPPFHIRIVRPNAAGLLDLMMAKRKVKLATKVSKSHRPFGGVGVDSPASSLVVVIVCWGTCGVVGIDSPADSPTGSLVVGGGGGGGGVVVVVGLLGHMMARRKVKLAAYYVALVVVGDGGGCLLLVGASLFFASSFLCFLSVVARCACLFIACGASLVYCSWCPYLFIVACCTSIYLTVCFGRGTVKSMNGCRT